MISRVYEIRDSATFIPVIAVKLVPADEGERYLLSRAGYGRTPEDQAAYVQLIRIDGGKGFGCCDPYDWPGHARTFKVAHEYIIKHWFELESGAVIDVEFILGETTTKKESERFYGI